MATEHVDTETGEVIRDEETSGVLATLERETIDRQIATAKKYPRSIKNFQRQALELATLDEETAKSMYYRLPRDGKFIEGGSVRLAEICASSWGNAHLGARVVDIDDRMLTAQAVAWDLEKNVRISVEIRRGIVNRFGKRYNDDMIRTTANAAMSIALRNAVFRIVSPALTKRILEEAKKVSLGKSLSMEQRRSNAVNALSEYGATVADILKIVGKKGLEDVDIDALITLQGIYTALKDGDATWASIMDALPKTEEEIAQSLKTNLEGIAKDLVGDKSKDGGEAQTVATRPKGGDQSPSPKESNAKKAAASKAALAAQEPEDQVVGDAPTPRADKVAEARVSLNAIIDEDTQDQLMDQATAVGVNPSDVRRMLKEQFGKNIAQLTNSEAADFSAELSKIFEEARQPRRHLR